MLPAWSHGYKSGWCWDWSDPDYELSVHIVTDELSGDLLRFFQGFISSRYPDWCIVLHVSPELWSEDGKFHVMIFSDEVFIPDDIHPNVKAP